MLMKLWPGDWEEKLDWARKKVDEDNGRGGTQGNGQFQKIWRFPRKKLWKKIGCLLSAPTFGLGGSILWYKDTRIIGKKRKRYSI